MQGKHARRELKLDGRDVEIHFSPRVRDALADLAAAVHFSEHFDPGMRGVLQHWADGKTQSLRDVLTAFPIIAEETFSHIHATNDERARDAWREICNQMPEHGFTLAQKHKRAK
jgi:hypothetical protein